VFHPPGSGYNHGDARAQMNAYLSQLTASECNQELISKNTKVLNYPDPKTKAGSNLNNKIYLLK